MLCEKACAEEVLTAASACCWMGLLREWCAYFQIAYQP
jgi:hypothetical protein